MKNYPKPSRDNTSNASIKGALDNAVLDNNKLVRKTATGKQIISPSSYRRQIQQSVLHHLQVEGKPSKYSLYGVEESTNKLLSLREMLHYISWDLSNCFENITYTRIVGLLRKYRVPTPEYWAKYVCYNGHLMRGGITSPFILELLLKRYDYRIAGIAHKRSLFYCRYADDMYIYSYEPIKSVNSILLAILAISKSENLVINPTKIKIQ